jgi:hypothetical protein
MIESWFIEEETSQEGWGIYFSSVIEGAPSEEEWKIRFVFNERGSFPLSLKRRILVSYISIWD